MNKHHHYETNYYQLRWWWVKFSTAAESKLATLHRQNLLDACTYWVLHLHTRYILKYSKRSNY